MLNVFITVDTEIWPDAPKWPRTPLDAGRDLAREIDWYFYGGKRVEPKGIPYQLRVLADAGLKATYFVDPLFATAAGTGALRDLVGAIRGQGQEIGLHLHPEWLTDPRCKALPRFAGPILHRYDETDQDELIRVGLDRLRDADAGAVRTFRAGSWGAARSTLRALRRNGIHYDSSLNARFRASFPDLPAHVRESTQPLQLEGVWEFPVTSFIDRPPEGRRPLHVCAASLAEFQTALRHAVASRWYGVVIVLHSFEFVRVDQLSRGKDARSQRLLAKRFERLCAFLATNADRFRTRHFSDLDADPISDPSDAAPATSSFTRTASRYLQQAVSRVY